MWDSVEDIDFEKLPDSFVLKCTKDSGGIVICKDKNKLDVAEAKAKLRKAFYSNYFYAEREWPYKDLKPRIIAEQYMEDNETKELRDYKFFCFDGEAKVMFVATERQKEGEEVKFDFFDMNYNHLDVQNGHKNATTIPSKPNCFDEMKQLAERLSKGLPQVRVDLYQINGKVYFGEMTFFHFGGLKAFNPISFDYQMGSYINLDKIKN